MATRRHETNQTAELVERLERDAGRTFDVRKVSDEETRTALRRLVRAGTVSHVGRGVYAILERPEPDTLVDDDELRLATADLDHLEHYVSWRAALSRHGLTEQDPRTVSVAVRGRHAPRVRGGLRVRPIYQSPKRFYDYRRARVPSGATIRLATPEKAIVDSLDRPDLGGGVGEVAKALRRTWAYDPDRLVAVARKFPSQATVARLGYLMSVLGIGDPSPLKSLVRRKGPPVPLDLRVDKTEAPIDPVWRIADNLGPERIKAWAER
jgi:predicted transcriptional regulator of viral defense system